MVPKVEAQMNLLAQRLTAQRIATNQDSSYLLIFDESRRRIIRINILDILLNKENATKSELLPLQMLEVSDIIYYNDSIVLYCPCCHEANTGRFSIFHFYTGEKTYTPHLPTLGFKVHPNNLYPIYATSSVCVNEKRNRFVAIPALLGELDFFDLSGNYIIISPKI